MRMFFVSGIGIAVFLEFLLLSKKRKSVSDQILTLWMFLITVYLFLQYIEITQDIYRFPALLGVELPLPLLQAVFLYLYVGSATGQLPRRRGLLALHFVPAAAMYLYLVTFFVLPGEQKIAVYKSYGAGYEFFNMIRTSATVLSGIVYVAWSTILLRRHRHAIRDRFSDLHRVNLEWLQVLTCGLGGIWLLVIFFGNDLLIMCGVVLFVFLIGFFGVRQVDIFRQGVPEPEPSGQEATEPHVAGEKKKYPKSGLTEEASEKLHRALLQLMSEQGLYKESELSITDLASRLDVHPNYLSQIINQREGKNFYDFVNGYRVEEFKRVIAIPKNQHLTLLSLAFDCGFNSKSSFNRYFKKATGETPSQYFTSLTGSLPPSA
jgi:AraC-like DNA-binding protein